MSSVDANKGGGEGGPTIAGVRTASARLPGPPFGVASTADGQWSFVSLPDGIAVVSIREFTPEPVGFVPIAAQSPPLGLALTSDAGYLVAAAGGGVAVLSVERAVGGRSDSVLGLLSDPGAHSFPAHSGVGVAISPDDAFAYVSREYRGDVAVFDLGAALEAGLRAPAFVGAIPLGERPVGMAVSADGRWLYATSQLRSGARADDEPGTLSVIDLRQACSVSAESVAATVTAGRAPVRVAAAEDGRIVWVTARGDDTLLGFSAAGLLSEGEPTPVAAVRTGLAPVGVAVLDRGRRVVVANSNRFAAPGRTSSLSVIDAAAATAGADALLGSVPAGGFPRELSLARGGSTLLVTNSASRELQAVDAGALTQPLAREGD